MMSGMMGMMSGKGKGNYDDDYGVSWNTFFQNSPNRCFSLTDHKLLCSQKGSGGMMSGGMMSGGMMSGGMMGKGYEGGDTKDDDYGVSNHILIFVQSQKHKSCTNF
jgi:hypothetical protein